MIPYGRQEISEADIEAVARVLRSDWLTQGPAVPQFEDGVARFCEGGFAVAVCNATAALHVACLALDLGPGDVLWSSPNTFVASTNCALYCGAAVDFVDIDPRTYNMSVQALEAKLQSAERSGGLPKVLVAVHFAGQACEMRAIKGLSEKYGFRIIEDASHAIGAEYAGSKVGSGLFSDITVFSFHPVKIITTGEGGMAVTGSPELAERMRLLRSHGITRDPALMERRDEGSWYYEQVELGFNYRMTDIQAALGLCQLGRLPDFVDRRRAHATAYDAALAGLGVIRPWQHPDTKSSFHLYPIRCDGSTKERKRIFHALRDDGVGVNVHYIPVHLQPFYRKLGFKQGDYPVAEAYYNEAISLPLFPGLTGEQQEHVIQAIRKATQ